MHKWSKTQLRLLLCGILLIPALAVGTGSASAQDCPTTSDEIATDRPDVTNSSRVVPYGSLQAENGVDWTVLKARTSSAELRPGCASASRNAPKFSPTCRRTFTRSTAAHLRDSPTWSSPSS